MDQRKINRKSQAWPQLRVSLTIEYDKYRLCHEEGLVVSIRFIVGIWRYELIDQENNVNGYDGVWHIALVWLRPGYSLNYRAENVLRVRFRLQDTNQSCTTHE